MAVVSEARQVSHQLAAKAATEFVKAAAEAGLSWADIAIGGETIVAIIVAATAEMSGRPDSARFSQEMVETITERAHGRVQALIRGVPYAG
jgi:hypothetical protein